MSVGKHDEKVTVFYNPQSRRQFLRMTGGIAGVIATGGIIQACTTPGASVRPTTAGTPGAATPGATTAATQAASLTPLSAKVQLRWLFDSGFAGFFAAAEKGYWRDEGLDIELVPGGPNIDVLQTVAGGAAPIGEGITDILIRAKSDQAVPIRCFGAIYQSPPSIFMSLAEKNITEPADFAGKRLATTAEGVPLDTAMLENAGVDPETVEFVMAGFDPSPLLTDEADIYQGFKTGQGVTLERMGHTVNYITYEQFGYDIYDGPMFATEETFQNNEDLLVRFLRGSIKGWEYNEANSEEVIRFTVDKYGIEGLDYDEHVAQNNAQIPLVTGDEAKQKGLFVMNEAKWQSTIDFLFGAKAIENTIDASEIMTTDIHTKAMAGKTKLL
jgi:NitT/TauT family transport system substrate-binding protein